LEKMTQLNRKTKVQKPLRRCLLSKKLSKRSGTEPSAASTAMSGTLPGTDKPAETSGATQAAIIIAAHPGTAKPAESTGANVDDKDKAMPAHLPAPPAATVSLDEGIDAEALEGKKTAPDAPGANFPKDAKPAETATSLSAKTPVADS
jgi:hypothetical protein